MNSEDCAFPSDSDVGPAGLTKFEYLVANAPDTIPDWFVPPIWDQDPPEKPKSWTDYTSHTFPGGEKAYAHAAEYHRGLRDAEKVDPDAAWYVWEWHEWDKAKIAFERGKASWKYFQWRKYYAEQIINML